MTASVSAEELRVYVRARAADSAFLEECLTAGAALINQYYNADAIPEALYASALKQVAGNIYQRRAAALEHAGLGEDSTSPFVHRPALNPLTPAAPLLAPYKKGVGFA